MIVKEGKLSLSTVHNLVSVLDKLDSASEEIIKSIISSSVYSLSAKISQSSENIKFLTKLLECCNSKIEKFISALNIAEFLGKGEPACIIE